jgi:putative DNA primase/helicase
VLQYDEFRDRIYAVDPPIRLDAERGGISDTDVIRVRSWFELVAGFTLSKDQAWDSIISAAKRNTYHPVREWLEGLAHTPGEFLDNAAAFMFGKADTLTATYVRKFLVGAVRRVLEPGTKMDTMLVLAGLQGAGKSTFVRTLFGEEWSSEDMPALDSKDAIEVLRGKWGIEVAELDKVLRADPETTKAFISRRVDTFRPSYGRSPEDRPRACVFVGTSNRDDFLKDATGSRRYWVVQCDAPNLEWIKANRGALFAAALDLARRGEQHWLTSDEEAQRNERATTWEERDAWHEAIEDFLRGKETVTSEEVFKSLGGMREGFDRKALLRITDTLRRLGCEKTTLNDGERRIRKWVVPEALKGAKVPAPVIFMVPKKDPE